MHDRKYRRNTTMTTYFVNCKNLDELKKAYKAAAMKNHPDKGGDTAPITGVGPLLPSVNFICNSSVILSAILHFLWKSRQCLCNSSKPTNRRNQKKNRGTVAVPRFSYLARKEGFEPSRRLLDTLLP